MCTRVCIYVSGTCEYLLCNSWEFEQVRWQTPIQISVCLILQMEEGQRCTRAGLGVVNNVRRGSEVRLHGVVAGAVADFVAGTFRNSGKADLDAAEIGVGEAL